MRLLLAAKVHRRHLGFARLRRSGVELAKTRQAHRSASPAGIDGSSKSTFIMVTGVGSLESRHQVRHTQDPGVKDISTSASTIPQIIVDPAHDFTKVGGLDGSRWEEASMTGWGQQQWIHGPGPAISRQDRSASVQMVPFDGGIGCRYTIPRETLPSRIPPGQRPRPVCL